MSTGRPNQCLSCYHMPALLVATGVVVLGTALVDLSRLWLLVVPIVFCLMVSGAGALVDRAVGGLLAGHEYPPMVGLSVRMGVGLACLSLVTFLSALSGMLWLAGLAALPAITYGCVCVIRASFRLRPFRVALATGVGGSLLGGGWLVAWLWATIPPTFYDELAYHLVIPQRVLETGAIQTTPWVFFTFMPHAYDLLLAWGMAFAGDLGARAIIVALWVACSLAAWGLAEGITGPGASPWAAALVAGALATSPMLWFLATLPFAETALVAAVVTAAVVLVAPPAERRPWLALGLVLGLAASVKLAGLYWVVAGLAATAVAGWTGRDTFRAGAVALASVAPWWVRAFVHTGNPIYPMAYGLLGGRPWSEESQARVMADLPYGAPGSLGLGGLLSLPLDMVQRPERFGSASEAGVLAVAATCLVLALPVISRVVGLSERGRRLGDAAAIFVALSGAGWVLTSPTTRFFAPAFVVGLAGLVGTLLYLRRAGRVVALIIILVGGVWGTARFLDQHAAVFSSLEVALGRESADAYLTRQLDHFAAARFVQERLPPDARLLLIGETRPYYFYREAMAPSAYDVHPLRRWVQESPSPEALAKRLAAEGFTHVVLNIYELKRLHDNYGLLAFSGDEAEANTRRLRELPRALRLLFAANGVYVFEVPRQ